jgi:predicted TIM-barrel fold metal-dependent hydrolase
VGTDYPLIPWEKPFAKTLKNMGFSDADLDAICNTNAFRFLGMEPPKA